MNCKRFVELPFTRTVSTEKVRTILGNEEGSVLIFNGKPSCKIKICRWGGGEEVKLRRLKFASVAKWAIWGRGLGTTKGVWELKDLNGVICNLPDFKNPFSLIPVL